MAEPKKSIFTAIGQLFSNSKAGEFTARTAIEDALAVTDREIKASTPIEPTVIADKGVSTSTIFTESGFGLNYHRYIERENMRQLRYALYERMDNDLIASALDVYANETTQKNQENLIVGVYSSSKYIQDELKDMLQRTGINNFKSWGIVRNMCKYGDHFESIKLDSKRGVLSLKELHTNSVYRIEKNGHLEGFVQDLTVLKDSLKASNASNATMNPYINLNTLALPYLMNNVGKMNEDSDESELEPFLKYELLHFRLRGKGLYMPYGVSVIDSAIDIWKKLDLLVDSLIIYRLNKAPSRFIFYIDAGSNQGANVENLVRKQINAIGKKEYFDANGKINERYNLLDMNANIYIPIQGKNSGSRVEMFQGATNLDQLEDLSYLNNRLFSALKVPKAFLGFEGDVNAKGTLSQQNVTFSKAIQNIQEDFLESVKNLCLIHLAIKGISTLKDLNSFDLVMTRPSYIEEKARLEIESESLNLASSYSGFGVNKEWIIKNILRKTDAEVKQMLSPSKYPPQQEAGASGGIGGIGGGLSPSPEAGGLPPEIEGQGLGQETPPIENQEVPQQLGGGNPAEGAPIGPPGPLAQSRRREGSLLIEGTNTNVKITLTAEFTDLISEIKKYFIQKNTTDNKETPTTVITEKIKSKTTEMDDIFNE